MVRCAVFGAWCNGAWCNGAWCNGACCMLHGACCMLHGAWCVLHGAWCMMHVADPPPHYPHPHCQAPRKSLRWNFLSCGTSSEEGLLSTKARLVLLLPVLVPVLVLVAAPVPPPPPPPPPWASALLPTPNVISCKKKMLEMIFVVSEALRDSCVSRHCYLHSH